MKKLKLFSFFSFITLNTITAQKKLIIIKANSNQVDIREDKKLFKKAWAIFNL